MLPLGHLGIGLQLARPVSQGLRARWILLGTVLPDLIDKPLFYGLRATDVSWPLITGTRTFGHTGLFLVALAALAWIRRSRAVAAVAIGVATHILIDNVLERFISDDPQAVLALLWPYFDGRFPVLWAKDASEHLQGNLLNPLVIGSEIIGAFFLGRAALRARRTHGEI